MFPFDKYTPHGYLDNPAYAWILGKGGILRSRPALGMEWHYPALPASYNPLRQYRTGLQFGFSFGNDLLLQSTQDFQQAGVTLYCDYHSKNILRYIFTLPSGLRVSIAYFLAEPVAGDALSCFVSLENKGQTNVSTSFGALLEYECEPANVRTWLSGLFVHTQSNGLVIGEWQEGLKVHLAASEPANIVLKNPDSDSLRSVLNEKSATQVDQTQAVGWKRASALCYKVKLTAGESREYSFVMTRAVTELKAVKAASEWLSQDGRNLKAAYQTGLQNDREFWRNVPRLRGNWPGHIRRGIVYDLETLRMMVRQPLGIYKHRWDAMQLQAPRTVLGEAALDMAILAYADADTAKEVLFGLFADAPEPNIPCSREDGSYNMVASDGSPCGTAPEWCFPFHCINLVYQITGDKSWLGNLYPYLEAFVGWWLAERTNAQGLPYYKCSWEAGQDNSPRFGIKDDPSGGGALTEHLWPVDLQAALAQACLLLARWGEELNLGSWQSWQQLGNRFITLTRSMWQPDRNWFHDYDTRTSSFTDVIDTMQLAPLLCGVASQEQIAALAPKVYDPPKHGQIFHPLMWPSIAFCAIEAASESAMFKAAALHSWNALDPVYRWLDSNPGSIESENGGVPGVGREYWPQVVAPHASPPHGGGGAEVYGWGCLGVMLLFRHVAGLREGRNQSGGNATTGFSLTPGLPDVLLRTGASYKVGPLHWKDARFNLSYRVLDETGKLELRLVLISERPCRLVVIGTNNIMLYQSPVNTRLHRLRLQIQNHESFDFQLL